MNVNGYMPELSYYPKLGTIKRSSGKGCLNCMRRKNCTEFYYLVRFQGIETITQDFGTSCTAYSENPEDKRDPKGEGEIYQNWKMNTDGIAQEATQNGETRV
ncbi:MAG: hypothetical protein M0P12_00955 [Paludibacteraceae bacterium]|jgi:hypothetical protein|nr:hypothetical protein [Paludibacteraceae bacterium]